MLPTAGQRIQPQQPVGLHDFPANLFIRGIDRSVADRLKTAARARGVTLGDFIAGLFRLHEAVRERADSGDEALAQLLKQFGLESVRV